MSRARFRRWRIGALVLLATVVTTPSMEAQYPASRRKTSAVGTVLSADTAVAPPRTGATRQLVCRGGAGLHVVKEHDPSPRSPNLLAVSLRYRRNSQPVGLQYDDLGPGVCSWNNGNFTGIPLEPGVVQFDLDREGSAWVPNPTTLQEYLQDPEHYWVFYVDDVTNVSLSHGAHRGRFWAADKREGKRRTSVAANLARTVELRCRGGAGLAFSRGASTGNNQLAMTLTYRLSQHQPGEYGRGLNPGTCAWVDRTGVAREPGHIDFTTAGNAQLKQIQSGSAVDRSPRAAERWPDAHTIPAYMTDWSHFWTFTVRVSAPETARTHEAWIAPQPPIALPSGDLPGNLPGGLGGGLTHEPAVREAARQPVSEITTTVAGGPSAGAAADTSRTAVSPPPTPPSAPEPSVPSGVVGGLRDASPTLSMPVSGVAGERTPGAADFATGRVVQPPLTLVRVLADPVRNRLLITFTARLNASPTVFYSRRQPVKDPGSGRWFFPTGGYQMDVAAGTAQAFRAEYRASSFIPGDRTETSYHYIITVPASADAVEQQLTGQFTMQGRVPPPPSEGFETNAN